MSKIILSALLAVVSFSFGLNAQNQVQVNGVTKTALTRLTNQVKSFPQEKIYLQIDKPYYSAGETLWFRANLLHASLHTPMNLSRYIYVELINSSNTVVERKKIRPDNKIYYGQISISPEIKKGWYSIRAYTNYMRNIDEDWYFRRSIYIGNSLQNNTTEDKTGTGMNQGMDKPEQNYSVDFFPEGGKLIAGNMQIIGFNAYDKKNKPIEITGRIIDENKKEICTFSSNGKGFGTLSLMPEAGKTYKAVCENNEGRAVTINLPKALKDETALSIQQNQDLILCSLLLPDATPLSDTLYIVAHQRCIPVYQYMLTPDVPFVKIAKEGMYSGITQFLLLDKKGNLVSDRQVFISGKDKAAITFQTDRTNYKKRDVVYAHITLKDSKGNPVQGNFSISVTDDNDVKINPDDQTIESYLLLQSDLKQPLSKPNSFFRTDNAKANAELDVLMLTKKWSRYEIPQVLAGNYARGDTFALEIGSTLSGSLMTYPAKKPIPDVDVTMLVQKRLTGDVKKTDKDGRFCFDGFEFPDSTTYFLQANKKSPFVTLLPDKDSFPEVKIDAPMNANVIPEKDIKSYLDKSKDKYYYENGMMVVNLKTIEIVSNAEEKYKDLRRDRGALYITPSQTINEEKLSMAPTILDALLMTPGVTMDESGTGVLIRNKKPLVLVDEIEYTMEDMNSISPSEVKLIDILKDPGETAIYGSQGANGVICIYLKRGEEIVRNNSLDPWQAKVTPLGYSTGIEFVGPKYITESQRSSSIPDLRSTIYWKPNVTCNENGEVDLTFYTADAPGTYTVTIEGVTPKGEIFSYRGKLNRK
jgi:TonB-dependent SusC/RagA subfamily outer membrane receptor